MVQWPNEVHRAPQPGSFSGLWISSAQTKSPHTTSDQCELLASKEWPDLPIVHLKRARSFLQSSWGLALTFEKVKRKLYDSYIFPISKQWFLCDIWQMARRSLNSVRKISNYKQIHHWCLLRTLFKQVQKIRTRPTCSVIPVKAFLKMVIYRKKFSLRKA